MNRNKFYNNRINSSRQNFSKNFNGNSTNNNDNITKMQGIKNQNLYNVISNGIKQNEAEFKILSARLSRKGSTASSSIGKPRETKVKSIENFVKNSFKDSHANHNINSNNTNLIFNSSNFSAKYNNAKKNPIKSNFNTIIGTQVSHYGNKNKEANTDLNNNKQISNFVNKNQVKNNQPELHLNLSKNSAQVSNINIHPKIKGIQIKNFNSIINNNNINCNNLMTKTAISNSDRTNKSYKKV